MYTIDNLPEELVRAVISRQYAQLALARSAKLSPARRSEIASKAAKARWKAAAERRTAQEVPSLPSSEVIA